MATGHSKGSSPSGKTVNRLNVSQLYKVCRYLEDLSPTFDYTTTKDALAVKVSDHFGFPVSVHSIGTCFEMSDLSIPKAPASEGKRLAILKRAIENVYASLEMALPKEWEEL